jgi:hypothetical protein
VLIHKNKPAGAPALAVGVKSPVCLTTRLGLQRKIPEESVLTPRPDGLRELGVPEKDCVLDFREWPGLVGGPEWTHLNLNDSLNYRWLLRGG